MQEQQLLCLEKRPSLDSIASLITASEVTSRTPSPTNHHVHHAEKELLGVPSQRPLLHSSQKISFPQRELSRSPLGPKEWKCKIEGCGAILKSKSSRFRHQRQHFNPDTQYACSFEGCDAKYLFKLDLVDHERKTHMDRSKFVECNICERTFSSISNLNAHKEMHHKPFIPPTPARVSLVNSSRHLSSPVRSINYIPPVQESPFVASTKYTCSVCSKVCFGIVDLHTHMRYHYNSPPPKSTPTQMKSPISPYHHFESSEFSELIECGLCDKNLKHGVERELHWEAAHFVARNGVCLVNGCGKVIKQNRIEWIHHVETCHSSLIGLI